MKLPKNKAVGEGLLIIGFIALASGIGGAIFEMVMGYHEKIQKMKMFSIGHFERGAEWFKAVAQFIETCVNSLSKLIIVLKGSPLWLALTVIGTILIILGAAFMPPEANTATPDK